MNLKELKEIIAMFERAEIAELELEMEGEKIRLRKGEGGAPIIIPDQSPGHETSPQENVSPAGETGKEAEAQKEGKLVEIVAPMVGTFYRAPSPEVEPFIEEGQEIEEDQVVCIIEAMKLMNEIKSEVKGKIAKILVENAYPVEFGQPLFLVEKT